MSKQSEGFFKGERNPPAPGGGFASVKRGVKGRVQEKFMKGGKGRVQHTDWKPIFCRLSTARELAQGKTRGGSGKR